ncbi:MAG: MBL fold metallo-hydrolase [Anaerolineae bacterium]|jgi:L-ascorbate 6-phosphate lactonase|nr:MBL fold metallo-hydrolase [Chloroflexota bacterium]
MTTGRALVDEISALQLPRGAMAFWWLGQLGYAVKIEQTVFYIDPFLAPGTWRNVPPLMDASEITNADWVLGTHDHGDHIDRWAYPRIAAASPEARFVCSRAASATVLGLGIAPERVIGTDEGQVVQDGDTVITPVASAHEFLDHDPELGYPYLGFVIQQDGVCLYHSGDTTRYEGMRCKLERWSFDAVFLPINGRDAVRYAHNTIGNMTYQESVDLAGELKPRLTVPGHYEMFSSNSENPQLFVDYMRVKYPERQVWVGEHGTCVIVPPREG